MIDIDLRCMDVQALVSGLPDASCDLVHADPPWSYDMGDGARGVAGYHYGCLPTSAIRQHLEAAYEVAADDAYLMCWCTFPLFMEWAAESLNMAGWTYITGGCWGKTVDLGVGIHFRGNAELLLLYRKGKPRPHTTLSNLWLDRRGGHSEKPQSALRALVSMATQPGGLVLDLYAGESASMARACRATGRRYVGAEIDPARHARALNRLALEEQATMELTA